ncbi:TPA: hypothetical protein ROX98_001819 [Bacillus pseudomycoides]|nr:hypothetical protein [Bacillus pseudomycoides]
MKKYKVIEEILPQYVGTLLIHEYVYHHEVLTPKEAKEQIDTLIRKGRAEIVTTAVLLQQSSLHNILYEDTVEKLRREKGTRENGNHWGEIVSIAYAHTMGIPYFLSDETDQQAFIDSHFSEPIEVIRIQDLILQMKISGVKRRDALLVWAIAGYAKERFNDLWPLNT